MSFLSSQSCREANCMDFLPTAHGPAIRQFCAIGVKSPLNFRKVEIEASFIGHTNINSKTNLSSLQKRDEKNLTTKQ